MPTTYKVVLPSVTPQLEGLILLLNGNVGEVGLERRETGITLITLVNVRNEDFIKLGHKEFIDLCSANDEYLRLDQLNALQIFWRMNDLGALS